MCPLSLRLPPDEWSIPVLVFFACVGLYPTWIAIRAIRRRRMDLYRDARLNPTGRRAVVHALVLLLITWCGVSLVVWMFVCGRITA